MRRIREKRVVIASVLAALIASSLGAQSEISPGFSPATEAFDHERREVMIPMRDGVRLHTVVVIPKIATAAPIILTRTPYGADKPTEQSSSPYATMVLPVADESLIRAGYIRV